MEQYINGSDGSTFALVSTLGGTVMDFSYQKINIIYPQRKVDIQGEKKSRGGIPICFPFFGPAINRFAGISQHGWLQSQGLIIKSLMESSITMTGSQRSEKFPWNLEYSVSVGVNPGILTVNLEVRRMQDSNPEDCPINPAFHPYFTNLGKREVKIGQQTYTDFLAESLIVPSERNVVIDNGLCKVQMSLGGDFSGNSRICLWSDDPDKYFCVEPMLAPMESFADDDDGVFLAGKEIIRLDMALRVMPPDEKENPDASNSRHEPLVQNDRTNLKLAAACP
ncbi:MAG: hypothetical protein V1756_00130 [Patescibacteria group bacterium]